MWKRPSQVTKPFAEFFWQVVMDNGLTARRFPEEGEPGNRLLLVWLNDIVAIARTSRHSKDFGRRIGVFLLRNAQIMESKPDALVYTHYLIQGLNRKLEPLLGSQLSQLADTILTYFVAAITTLMGSETRVLVGAKGNQYVWKKVRKIAPDQAMAAAVVGMYATYAILPAIGPNEAWMIPDFRELDGDAKALYEEGDGHREQCEDLIERAFYGQEYTIDPEGVYVRIVGAQEDVTGIYLKVQSRGNELLNILARIETSKGAFFIVVAEDQLLNGATKSDVLVRGATKFDLLVCQVYHDLVTVHDAPIARVDNEGKVLGAPPSRRSTRGASWTVIPRRVRNQVRSPRSSAPSPTSVKEPVSVVGHPRRARMTEKHRQELLRFEQETGLVILSRLPEGKTYVRPHFSPKLSNEEVRRLPRFVRYRMQQRLDESLRDNE